MAAAALGRKRFDWQDEVEAAIAALEQEKAKRDAEAEAEAEAEAAQRKAEKTARPEKRGPRRTGPT